MRFLHTADWHIGRRLHGFDLSEEQKDAFQQIETAAKKYQVDGIIIAGDIYDRKLPAEKSVQMLNHMLRQLNLKDHFPIYAISGNHDSATRLSTGAPWYRDTNFYMHTSVAQSFQPVELPDVQLFLLPYFEPFEVQQYFQDSSLKNVSLAFDAIVSKMKTLFDPHKKHILVSHFFASGSSQTDSETQLKVGGLAAVPVDLLSAFDYVALGHLHGKDAIHDPKIQYSGSPIKFSMSEAHQKKGFFIVDTDHIQDRTFVPLKPKRDVQQISASFEKLTDPKFYQQLNCDNYFGFLLKNQKPIPNVMQRLRKIYPHIASLSRAAGYEINVDYDGENGAKLKKANPMEVLNQFYQKVANEPLSDQQKQWAEDALQNAHDGRKKP
ncbi:nuclease SbcCD subunit D [Philodulcilactobacillus myokoensis]|uniref:Nuclease SbcCD subunit D n=1 Tax=Philodulcilactobacillus myokoensis TaxID=2929573 RepID=A0A9W6AZ10_9LACO|nr:exonuclease SbcCD subunit D [Philodulcilactobacillus myokoensis]GLB46219.1 nuclease SbcCD subunit D [Philodulcilactobacillus myokoensis]